MKMMKFHKATQDNSLVLEHNRQKTIKWYMDTALPVHNNFRSHTEATMAFILYKTEVEYQKFYRSQVSCSQQFDESSNMEQIISATSRN